jgi:hypothetical protein
VRHIDDADALERSRHGWLLLRTGYSVDLTGLSAD